MAEGRPRLVVVPPGGIGIAEGLTQLVRQGTVVTAYSDKRLQLANAHVSDDNGAEVVPMGELLSRVLRMMGAPAERVVTRGQREAMTQLACESLQGDSPLERSARFRGTARLVAKNLEKLRHHGVEGSALRLAASQASGALTSKLEVLAEVSDLVRDSMDVSHREFTTDRVHRCLDGRLPENPLHHLIVIAGPDEHPLYDQWCVWLAGQGIEVEVVVELVPERGDLFRTSQTTVARLNVKGHRSIGEGGWAEHLFSTKSQQSDTAVEVFSAGDPLSETEWAFRRILRHLGQGTPASRIGIYVRDPDLYSPLIAAVAQQTGVETDTGPVVPLLSCGFAAAVLAALGALAKGDVRKVARLSASTYFPTPPETQEALWHRASTLSKLPLAERWTLLSHWVESQDPSPAWLAFLLKWREETGSGSARLTQWLDRLRHLVGDTAMVEAVTESKDSVRERDLRAQTVLQRSIADYSFVYDQAGQHELTLAGFARLAERVWQDESVTLPGSVGGVKVFTDTASLVPLDVLFVPGMLEGTFPRRRREDPLLADEDLSFLSTVTGTLLPDSREIVRQERDEFVRLCASAPNALHFSYPLTTDEQDSVKTLYLEELKRVLGGGVEEVDHRRGDWVPAAEAWEAQWDTALRTALTGPRSLPESDRVNQAFAKDVVRPDWEEGVTPAQLSTALACPFQSVFRHTLGLKSPARRVGTWVLLQLPRKARLAEARNREEATVSLESALAELLERLAPDLEDWEAGLLKSTGDRFIADWVEREFLARTLWPRDVPPVADVEIGESGLKANPKVARGKIQVKGRVAAAGLSQGFSFVQTYVPSTPDTDDFEHRVATDNAAFGLGLELLVQHGRSPKGIALEVDSAAGERSFAYIASQPAKFRGEALKGLTVKRLGESSQRIFRAVMERLDDAVSALDQADARATPGSHCADCLYGDLCRKSPDDDNDSSPFGADTVK